MFSVSLRHRAVALACLTGLLAIPLSPSAQAQGADRSGFYASLHGGANVPLDTHSTFASPGLPGGVGTITTTAEDGYRLGGALGFIFNRYLRAEAELSYTRNDLDTLAVVSRQFPRGSGPLPAKGDATALSGMVNGYLSLPIANDQIRPYVGAGIGVARVSANGAGFAGVPGVTDDTDNAFSWQLLAGVGFKLSPAVELGARYRFQHINGFDLVNSGGDVQRIRDSEAHSVEVTLTWAFQQ
ncbi:MAG: acyloxyacyl hydrolase [Hyphomonadaceae bacterium]|jgi:opacity protein-like surface antigen|nr:acyloxyacyl hydrolase [Hyphomonadaceae bacterium]